MAKDSVNAAYETTLRNGLAYEKRLFYSSFATVYTLSRYDLPSCSYFPLRVERSEGGHGRICRQEEARVEGRVGSFP